MPMRLCHQMFLQSFMSRGILMGRDVRKLYKMTCSKFNEPHPDDGLVEFVSNINAAIKPIHLEIRKAITEDTGTHCYGLVNTQDSDITKFASDYTVNELEYFKKLTESVVESDSGLVSSIDALNLVSQMEKMTKHDAQELLNKLERQHWVAKNVQGSYSLAPRAILELEQFLFEQYPDSTVKCNMCKRICLQGQICSDCPVKLHKHCASTYFGKKAMKTCPGQGCEAAWTHEITAPKTRVDVTDDNTQNVPVTQETRKRR